ncbi:DUF2716 domain-containing protein [Actinoplanes campanulatus]|uniref:DUF2716 domain-containing protein n=1 Tax=Actinoplanes campanulatus TaxID=113559 RepID=UPI0035D4BBDA
MSGPGWDNAAWQQIRNYEQFWTPFDDRFHFRPGTDSATWPAIKEPAGSVTFDLSSVFERAGGFSAGGGRAERTGHRQLLRDGPEVPRGSGRLPQPRT